MMADELEKKTRIERSLTDVRPRTVDDFPARDWKDAGAERRARGIPDPAPIDRHLGQTPVRRRQK